MTCKAATVHKYSWKIFIRMYSRIRKDEDIFLADHFPCCLRFPSIGSTVSNQRCQNVRSLMFYLCTCLQNAKSRLPQSIQWDNKRSKSRCFIYVVKHLNVWDALPVHKLTKLSQAVATLILPCSAGWSMRKNYIPKTLTKWIT